MRGFVARKISVIIRVEVQSILEMENSAPSQYRSAPIRLRTLRPKA